MERTGNITFSVIVPVYNVQAYLSACVKSVVEPVSYTHLTLPTT